MTQENLVQKGFKEGEEQWNGRLIEEAKRLALATLEKIEEKKKEKAKVEEELRVLKLDLEDLKAGKMDKIMERQKKSVCARGVSKIVWQNSIPWTYHSDTWGDWLSGTYVTSSGKNYYF